MSSTPNLCKNLLKIVFNYLFYCYDFERGAAVDNGMINGTNFTLDIDHTHPQSGHAAIQHFCSSILWCVFYDLFLVISYVLNFLEFSLNFVWLLATLHSCVNHTHTHTRQYVWNKACTIKRWLFCLRWLVELFIWWLFTFA